MRSGRRALALVLGLLMLAAAGCTAPSPAAPAARHTSTAPSASPVPAQDLRTAAAVGAISGWTKAAPTEVGEVAAAVGTVADGNVAVIVDAPAAAASTTVLSTKVPVDAGTSYDFSGSFRSLTTPLQEGAVTVTIDDTVIAVPALDAQANWKKADGRYTAPADARTATISISVNAPVRRLAIDGLSLTDDAGNQVLPNPSFETVTKAPLLANSSLTMSTAFATLAIAAPSGEVKYSLTRPDGTVALSGAKVVSGSLDGIPLVGVTQGFYALTVTDVRGRTATASIGVIDTPSYDIPLDTRFGTVIHVQDEHYAGRVRYASTLGLGSVGSDVLWRLNEKSKGKYNWDRRYDSEFARLRASGMELGATINYGNKLWGNDKVPSTAAAIKAYGQYAAAVAARYRPEAIEIFNEFNSKRFNKQGCGATPDCYLPLVKSVSSSVRKVDPNITLIAGATANYDSKWFARLWSLGGARYVDAMSFHPYSANSRPDGVGALVSDAQSVSAKKGGAALPVWITETGSSSKIGGRTLPGQGDFLMAMESSLLASGVERVRWYDLMNGTADPKNHERNFGLFEYEPRKNTAALSLKPSGYAQALLVANVGGKPASGSPAAGEGVVAHAFGRGEDTSFVVWAPQGSATAKIAADRPLVAAGVYGQQTVIEPVDGVVTIGVSPAPVILTPAESPAVRAGTK